MSNMIDYLSWRGDIPFSLDPLNEVDSLVFARLAYIPWSGIVPYSFQESISLTDAAEQYLALPDAGEQVFHKDDVTLLKLVSESPRYQGIRLCGHTSKHDYEKEEQFSAVILLLDENTSYITYRGTDNTLVGWKEDFNMSFHFPVPVQQDALAYFRKVGAALPGRFYLGGHSKGGNVAVFAAAYSEVALQSRIIRIFNLDGPGFGGNALETDLIERYEQIADRTTTYVPQSSIVGMLFNHHEDYIIIHAEQAAFHQHDLYTWQIDRNHLIQLEEQLSGSSVYFDKMLHDWCASMPDEQRELFYDTVYDLLMKTNAETLPGLTGSLLKSAMAVSDAAKELSPEMRQMVTHSLRKLTAIAVRNIGLVSDKDEKKKITLPKAPQISLPKPPQITLPKPPQIHIRMPKASRPKPKRKKYY